MPVLANDKHERFCQEYLVDFNATQAAKRAGYSPRTAGSQAHDLLKKPEIQARLAELKVEIAARLQIDQDEVFNRWWNTANADPNELTQHRRGSCRYCHGVDGLFQWKSIREFNEAFEAWQIEEPSESASDPVKIRWKLREPNGEGGTGYRITNDPNPDCAECAGLGVSYVYIADSRKLSAQARLLYEGVKETKNGIEVIMADRAKNLEMVARNLGMLKDEVKHDVTDRLGTLLQTINAKGSASPIRGEPK